MIPVTDQQPATSSASLESEAWPEQLDIMVTGRCNAHCPFCVQEITYKYPQATDEEFLRAADASLRQFHLRGGRKVVITGGEPLLSLDRVVALLKLLRHYSGFEMTAVYTNGALLLQPGPHDSTATTADVLKQAGLGCVNISIHHHEDPINNRILGLPRKRWSSEILAYLRTIGLPFRLNTTLQQGGIWGVEELIAFLNWAAAFEPQDLYFRELFAFTQNAVNAPSGVPHAEYCQQKRVDARALVARMRELKEFVYLGEAKEDFRDKTEWRFLHSRSKSKLYIASLRVGDEKRSGIPYLVLAPDGRLYRGWLGPIDILPMVG